MVLFLSCQNDFNNPVDPDSDNYQGYDTVEDVNDIKPHQPENDANGWRSFFCSYCPNADMYQIQISVSSNFDVNVIDATDTDNNIFVPVSESMLMNANYFWRVRGRDAESGNWGTWSTASSFFRTRVLKPATAHDIGFILATSAPPIRIQDCTTVCSCHTRSHFWHGFSPSWTRC